MRISKILRRIAQQFGVAGLLLLALSTANAKDFVYANNDVFGLNTVTAFEVTVNGSGNPTGLLNIGTFATGGMGSGGGFFAANRLIVCVVGNFLYVANGGDNTISVFSIDPMNGNLTPVGSPASAGGSPPFSSISLGVTPDGMFLVAANSGSQDISVFDIGTTPGILTPVSGSPFSVPAAGGLDGIRVTPDGKFVAVAEPSSGSGSGFVHMLTIDSAGALAPIFGSPFADSGLSDAGATGIDVNCQSDRLYAGEATAGTTIVSVFNIDDGSVTGTAGSLIVNSVANPGTGVNSNVVLLSRDQKHLFVSNQFSSEVSAFDVGPSGGLTPVSGSPFLLNGSPPSPSGMATNLAGTLLYVGSGFETVSVLEIAPSGALADIPGSPFSSGVGTTPLSVSAYPSSICGLIPVANDDPTPGGLDDPIEANSGGTINIDVLFNDDPGDGVASIVTTTPASGGTAIADVVGSAPNLSVDFRSNGGFGGTDTFTYFIVDINGDKSGSATVTIEVDSLNADTEPSEDPPPVFGAAAFPTSTAPMSATIDVALTGGTTTARCCTVRNPNAIMKNGKLIHLPDQFDIGKGMNNPQLADADCAGLSPGNRKLIVQSQYGVHTDPAIANPGPQHNRYGICRIDSEVLTLGPVFMDMVARNVVGYDINTMPTSVSTQPITLALTVDVAGYREPFMRSISGDLDPRGSGRWSTSFYIVNAQHLQELMSTNTYLLRNFARMEGLLVFMHQQKTVDKSFLNDVKSLVLKAQKNLKRKPQEAVRLLDDAARLTLLIATVESGSPSPPSGNPYGSSTKIPNPQADLVSYAIALRYSVCSEAAFPSSPGNPGNVLTNCEMEPDIVAALPALPEAP